MKGTRKKAIGRWLVLSASWLSACGKEVSQSQDAFFFVDHVSNEATFTTFERASLPSLREEGYLSAPVTLDDDTRICLTPPLSSRLSFAVELPPDPVIRFAIATSTLSRPRFRSPVLFKLLLQDEDGQETVFREAMVRRQRNRWLDREVDLDRWAGSKVRLTFETNLLAPDEEPSDGEEELFPLWANPVLSGGDGRGKTSKIILISIDCLRADHVGVYGYERATTPHIDRLADDGVVFETAISTSASTFPTHTSMLTGLTPSFHGASKWQKLARSMPYLSELLGEADYQADAVVSGAYLSQHFGFHRGFHSYRYLPRHRAGKTVDSALELLRRAGGQDHFLFMHLIDVHWPYDPPAGFIERFRATKPDVDYLARKLLKHEPPDGPDEVQQIVDLYDAEVAYTDREIGRFLDGLEEMNLYDQSLIILTADHGEAFYEHGLCQHTISLYDEVIHIPLIVKWPGNSVTGRVRTPVSQASIFSTILEHAGVDLPHSVAASLGRQVGDHENPGRRRPVVSEFTTVSAPEAGALKVVSLRTLALKYIATFRTKPGSLLTIDEILKEELYDLARDPGETRNLLGETPVDLRDFHRELRDYLDEARKFEENRIGERVILDETIRKRLEGLGYVTR